MGVLIGIGLWISGVPSAAALGLLAGLSEFIPYVWPTAAMIPALGLAATQGNGPLIGALATYAILRAASAVMSRRSDRSGSAARRIAAEASGTAAAAARSERRVGAKVIEAYR